MMAASPELFIIDANSLITPYLRYYPFDFARTFWVQVERHIADGNIVLLDLVKSEVERGGDALSNWISAIPVGRLIDHREVAITQRYSDVLDHVQTNPCYKPSALAEWSRGSVADPWLIACCMVHGFSIVTFEELNAGLNQNTPSKNAKIPNVSAVFGVKTIDLFYMMRSLKFML